ncbi:hypothetical protein EUGRSUZ_B02416 [Eucalyptus grandis]|uniref:Uncharacterized protein n=2 Tax=Eucalyptus grandis TaxID=71139 RepID=A0ACC3LTC5_EUCGR|nr:hypothetical protein EUGRSUZ_B02416 [Eucalyptus grandis]
MATSHLSLFLVALSAISASADVLWNIDCGSSDTYIDGNFIGWIGDNDLIQNGQSEVVQSSNSVDHVMSTLRVFTTRKKNCYSLEVEKGGQIYARASFYYGNYDQKSAPPTFDLHYDGNYWTTVETSNDRVVYYETTYVTQPNQYPFMSALEVRSLGSNMYKHVDSNYALYLKARVAYGTTKDVRYSADAYDRIWQPAAIGTGLTVVASDALFIDITSIDDNPPQAVMQNAVTTSKASESIQLTIDSPAKAVPIYMNLYFSEVTQLGTTQKRSFELYADDKPLPNPEIIVPPYGTVTEMWLTNFSASSNTSFSLVATSDSTLPPLINAMEVFYVDALTDGTNSKDVDGLSSLQTEFTNLQDWSGDPCLPSPYTWDWLNCSSDATPRVTALNLADNKLTGQIPSSLSKNNKIKLTVSGNPELCVSGKSCKTDVTTTGGGLSDTPSTSSGKKTSKLPAILGGTIPAFFVIWIIAGVALVLHQNRKRAAITAMTAGGANTSNGRPQAMANNGQMGEKLGQVAMNEFRVNMEQQMNNEISELIHEQLQDHDNRGVRND